MPAKDEPGRKGVEPTVTSRDRGGGQQGQNHQRDRLRRQDEADKAPGTPRPDPLSGGQYERGTGKGTKPDKA